jgi:predicted transcriptional regulator
MSDNKTLNTIRMAAVIVKELVERLNLQVSAGQKGLDRKICGGYCGDLLSNVMGKSPEGCVWLTVQTHQNIVAVAVLKEMAAIVITGGYEPDKETVEKADMEGIPLLLWDGSAFDLAGRIYSFISA